MASRGGAADLHPGGPKGWHTAHRYQRCVAGRRHRRTGDIGDRLAAWVERVERGLHAVGADVIIDIKIGTAFTGERANCLGCGAQGGAVGRLGVGVVRVAISKVRETYFLKQRFGAQHGLLALQWIDAARVNRNQRTHHPAYGDADDDNKHDQLDQGQAGLARKGAFNEHNRFPPRR